MRLFAKDRLGHLWPAAALLLIIIASCWKLVLTDQYTWLDNPDLANQVLPWMQFQAREWHLGRFPMWDPHELGGHSLLGQMQPGAAYPLNWLLFLLPLREGSIRLGFLHWYLVLIHYMAALFCYWLCRDLNRSRGASIFAALVFGIGGWIGRYDWPQMLNGIIWTPLVFLFLLRATRGKRPMLSGALAGTFLGIAFLSGHHQFPILILLAAGGVWLFHIWRAPRVTLRAAAAFLIFLFLVSALQTFPAYEYGRLAVRWVGAPEPVGWQDRVPYYVHVGYSLPPATIAGMIVPGLNKTVDPFMGLAVLAMAFLAIVSSWGDRAVRLFGVVALAGLLYALGGYSVFHGVLYAVVPLVEKARTPAFAIALVQFGLAVLAAFGIDHFLDAEVCWMRRVVRALAAIGGLLFVLVLVLRLLPDDKGLDSERAALTAVSGLLLAGLLYAWKNHRLSRTGSTVLLTMLMLLEIGSAAGSAWLHRRQWHFLTSIDKDRDLAEFLHRQPDPVRAEADDRDIAYNFGDYYGIDFFGGSLPSVPKDTYLVIGRDSAHSLWGINWHIGTKPSRPGQVEMFTSEGGLKAYFNPDAFPYVWSVHDAVSVSSAQLGIDLQKPLADLRRQAFVVGEAPPLARCAASDTVTLIRRDSNGLSANAQMSCKGMVIVSENAYPGWQAAVDGRPAAIYKAYGFLRGVVVDAGRHRIVMRYRPRAVIWGGALTAFGLLAAAIAPWIGRRGAENSSSFLGASAPRR